MARFSEVISSTEVMQCLFFEAKFEGQAYTMLGNSNYRIPCECGKVNIGETERPMQDRITGA